MKKLFLGAALLSAALSINAQTVDEISTKHLAALGGKDNLAKVQSVVMEGSMEAMGQKVDMKMVKVPGKLSRNDMSLMGMNGYTLITDTSGWMFMPFLQQTEPQSLPAEALKAAKEELSIDDALVDYQTKGNKIELQGKEDVAGADCYKMKVISAAGDTSTIYIDSKTYLLARTSSVRKMMDQEMVLNVDYTDYKDIDGVKFPFSMVTPQGAITFTTIKTNQTIDPKLYKP